MTSIINELRPTSCVNNIKDYLNDGLSCLESLTETQLNAMLRKCNDYYYSNNKSLMTDSQYDMLKEYIEENFQDNEVVNEGHTNSMISVEKNKVKLPFEMWSMDKIKDEKSIKRKLNKYTGPYVITAKMDGISGLYHYDSETNSFRLFTRGNGTYGLDISWMIDYLNLPKIKNLTVRGELIIKKQTFNDKYKQKFANPRNFVSGVANSKNIDPEIVRDLDFVVYEVVSPVMKPSTQIRYLGKNFSNPVKAILYKKTNKEHLSKVLLDWRENLAHEIDGVIVCNDKIYPRITGNPEHAFAFKMVMSDQIVESMVLKVIWSPSKDGYVKPKLQIKPVYIGGACIQYVTAHNAGFVVKNKLGVGSVIQIIRSGDIIPKVHKIIHNSNEPNLPSDMEVKWSKNKVDLILVNAENNDIVKIKQYDDFFKKINVVGLGRGNLKRIFEAGFTSLEAIINMKLEDYLTVEGFKDTLSNKIMNSIKERLKNVDISDLMTASNVFGRGIGLKKMKLIMENYPDILTSNKSNTEKVDDLVKIEGFSEKTANMFVPYIEDFFQFMNNIGIEDRLYDNNNTSNSNHILSDKKIVMSGSKNKTLKNKFKEFNIPLSSSVSKNTDFVIVTSLNESTSKIEKAKKLKIPIVLADQVLKKYFQ